MIEIQAIEGGWKDVYSLDGTTLKKWLIPRNKAKEWLHKVEILFENFFQSLFKLSFPMSQSLYVWICRKNVLIEIQLFRVNEFSMFQKNCTLNWLLISSVVSTLLFSSHFDLFPTVEYVPISNSFLFMMS